MSLIQNFLKYIIIIIIIIIIIFTIYLKKKPSTLYPLPSTLDQNPDSTRSGEPVLYYLQDGLGNFTQEELFVVPHDT